MKLLKYSPAKLGNESPTYPKLFIIAVGFENECLKFYFLKVTPVSFNLSKFVSSKDRPLLLDNLSKYVK